MANSIETKIIYERISLGIDIGTSHCEVVAFGKSYDPKDEEKYVFTENPISMNCTSSLISFAKNNETSINFLLKFQKTHGLTGQTEYLNGVKTPYVFFDQVDNLIQNKVITNDEFEIIKRSTTTYYPIKTKLESDSYSDLEIAVIRLNIARCLKPYLDSGLPLDITFAKPCEVGARYDEILKNIAAAVANKNKSNDNRFIIKSEAVFTGHYLMNMLQKPQGVIAICDIGAGTGDVYVYDQDDSKTKAMKSFGFAGNQATLELIKKLKEHSDVDITERDANMIKEKFGFITGFNEPETIRPVIVDLYVQGKPRKIRAGKSLDAAARPMAHEAVKTIISVFRAYAGLHPKTLAITGYQGQLDGLDKTIEEGLRIGGYEVTVLNLKEFGENDPRSIVAKGAEDYSRSINNQSWTIL